MIIVTGGAGFIGSCIVAQLNAMGREDITIVDHIEDNEIKKKNLTGKRYEKYFDKKDFLNHILADPSPANIESIIHMGACSSTMLDDARYYQENNFEYSCHVAQWSLRHGIRFIYASSAATYGDGSLGYSDEDAATRRLKPLNLYGKSKHQFDVWALDNKVVDTGVGLKFFNVFGPNEYHKEDMRSVIVKAFPRVVTEGKISLFKSYKKEYPYGEQKRDFIYVKDAVEIVLFFLKNPQLSGIYNVGTGTARSWNDVARALFAAVKKELQIEYIDMPHYLRNQYQYFTQANMKKLRAIGYTRPFTPLEDAIQDYCKYLKTNSYL